MYLDMSVFERKFKKCKETTGAALPETLTWSDVDSFSRILACTSLDEVADISNEAIAGLFEKIFPFVELMDVTNSLVDDGLERRMRLIPGQCPRRIL